MYHKGTKEDADGVCGDLYNHCVERGFIIDGKANENIIRTYLGEEDIEEEAYDKLSKAYPKHEFRNGNKARLQASPKTIKQRIKAQIKNIATLNQALAAIEQIKKERAKQNNPTFLPDLAVWINQRRWEGITIEESKEDVKEEGWNTL